MARTIIHAACERQGYCVLSEGTAHPGIIISRLLTALRRLAPTAEWTAQLAAISTAVSPAALEDTTHPDWDLPAGQRALDGLVQALNAAAPPGFVLCVEGDWTRVGFFR